MFLGALGAIGAASALTSALYAPPDLIVCPPQGFRISLPMPEQAVPLSPSEEKRIGFIAKGENRQIGENDKNK
jgi:hypothetical protein